MNSYLPHNIVVPGPMFDIDAMLFDVSNRMARAQLQRQISNTSSAHRPRPTRITKPNSAGNSPQRVQRRRAMTSYKAGKNRPELNHHDIQALQSSIRPPCHRPGIPNRAVRPMSWHPSTMVHEPQRPYSMYEVPQRQSFSTYQTVDIHGMPTPMARPFVDMETSAAPYFSLDTPLEAYRGYGFNGYSSAGMSMETAVESPSYITEQQPPAYSVTNMPFSAAAYPRHAWTDSNYSCPVYTAPATPDILPIQNDSTTWQDHDMQTSSLPRKESKELIGMGLYDDGPDRNSFNLESLVDTYSGTYLTGRHGSMGKGLKLEETWEPPEEEEESEDEDEDKSEGNGGEHENTVTGSQPPVPVAVDDTTVGGGNDMSNRSFFFDGNSRHVEMQMPMYGREQPILQGSGWR